MMPSEIFDFLSKASMLGIGALIGIAFSLYFNLAKRVKILEKIVRENSIKASIVANIPVVQKRKAGRPPKSIEMKNPQS